MIRIVPLMAVSLMAMLATTARAQLDWRVSVKFILDSNGNRPSSGSINTDAEVQAQIDLGNAILDAMGRGYRLRLTEIVDVAGISGRYDDDVCDDKTALDNAAKNNKSLYQWSDSAINIYINGTSGSGCCSFPGSGDDVIFVGQGLRTTTFIHEIGHFMDLCHTQGCPCGGCDSSKTGQCHTTPGNDNIADTLPDLECWDQDDIANWTYGGNYNTLTSAQQVNVDEVFNNIMSYHSNRNLFTPTQLDIATDTSNGSRSFVATGRTRFVNLNNNCLLPNGELNCTIGFGGPFPNVAGGVGAANSGDIVLIRTGTYSETLTINKNVFLRATRGNALIGAGVGAAMANLGEPLPYKSKLPDTDDGRTGQ